MLENELTVLVDFEVLNSKDISGGSYIESYYGKVVATHVRPLSLSFFRPHFSYTLDSFRRG